MADISEDRRDIEDADAAWAEGGESVPLEDLEDEFEDSEDDCVRAKGVMDDATTLAEAAQKVRAFADELQRLHEQGYVLDEPVADDYGFYSKP